MIAVSNLAKAFGRQSLFSGVAFQLNAGSCYGLTGANGSGKSTLLRILAGTEPPSDGVVSVAKRLRLGVLQQDHFQYEEVPILDVVVMGNPELWEAMSAKEELLSRADESFDADRYSELEEIVVRHDGYTVEARAAEILEGLGIPAEVHREPLSTLSGGFKLRVLLAQVLASAPDALLLDEPTNHLDILSIRWLEKFLQDYAGCVVVISHDHRFLDNVCDHILDVDYETVILYSGNYADFQRAKVEERERKEAEIGRREKAIAHHQTYVDRFRAKASKARQAQSKLRMIEKMAEDLEPLPQSSRRYPSFSFRQSRPSGKDVIKVRGLDKAYGDNQVLEGVDLDLRRGDRLAIIGPNGIGKSTLLKIMVGEVEADAGEIEWGYEARRGYFAQDHREQFGEGRQSVEAWFWEFCPGEPIGFVRGQLARVLFSKHEVEKKVGSLSGGEAARLTFAQLSVQQPNVLILDEPTNHLDLEAIEALVQALEQFDGTLVFVSHDRWFVSRLASRVLEISPEGLNDFPGTYDEYLANCGDDHLDAEAVALKVRREKRRAKERERSPGPDPKAQKQRKKIERRIAAISDEIEGHEARVHEINEIFCDPTYFDRTPRREVQKLEREQQRLAAATDELMAEWETLEAELADA
jgi:ATPase subunit of ABC transporter with duplicated ATPase domains